MSAKVLPLLQPQFPVHTDADLRAQFEKDITDLLSNVRQGHMERWEYWHADYPGDPAGGGVFWDHLIKNPGAYYLPRCDMATIAKAAHNPLVDMLLQNLDTLVELGPGNFDSIAWKTMPLLRHAKRYIAVDQTRSQAEEAAQQVWNTLAVPSEALVCDYLHTALFDKRHGRKGFFMWGGALGNIEGRAGEDSLGGLVNSLRLLADGCNQDDTVFISLDVEQSRERIMSAYNIPLLSQKFLSILYAAKKFGLVQGKFTPETWTHRSLWHNESWQCAHYLIAGADQDFVLRGQRITIKAGESVITNNSYKFPPSIVAEAARIAGFRRAQVTEDQPMALLIATK